MKNYERPVLRVVELQVSEHIAALVPKTIYKKTGSAFERTLVGKSDLLELGAYGTSNQLS